MAKSNTGLQKTQAPQAKVEQPREDLTARQPEAPEPPSLPKTPPPPPPYEGPPKVEAEAAQETEALQTSPETERPEGWGVDNVKGRLD